MKAKNALARIERCGIIAALRGSFDEVRAIKTCEILYEQGIDVFEFTMNSAQPIPTLKAVKAVFQGRALVCMGTVLDTETAHRVIDAGADFLLSPGCDPAVVKTVHDAGLLMCPGVLTPTEILGAARLSVKLHKLFPVGPVGVGYLRAIKGPLRHMKFLCDGGMNLDNVPEFLAAGATACGLVEALTGDGTESPGAVRERAKRLMNAVSEVRAKRAA